MNLGIKYLQGKPPIHKKKIGLYLYIFIPLLIFGIGPLIADQVTSGNQTTTSSETSTVQSSIESSPSPEPTVSPTIESKTEEEVGSGSESNSDSTTASVAPTPTKEPPHAVANQNMVLQIPRVQRLDPRAKQFNLPQVSFYPEGSPFLMLCMNSSWGIIDLEAKGISDSFSGKDVFIQGDLSDSVQVSGTSSQVLNIFNSFGGLRLKGPDGKAVVGTNLYLRFVAISEPTDNFALCGESQATGQWLTQLQPLGLQVNTKKNPLNLGDKTKKP